MIRLIATDVDGTFCYSDGGYNRKRFELQLRKLQEMGIVFVIASGNETKAMYEKFYPYSDSMYLVCDNGCSIARGKTMLKQVTADSEEADKIAMACLCQKNLVPIVSCQEHCFMLQKDWMHVRHFEDSFSDIVLLESLLKLPEKALKFSVVDMQCRIDRYLDALKKDLPEGFEPVTAGNECIDIMNRSVSKASGLLELINMLDILPEECMAFGDQMNDMGMLELAGYSYAMENAVPALKKKARYVAPSNDDEGVMQVIDDVLNGVVH